LRRHGQRLQPRAARPGSAHPAVAGLGGPALLRVGECASTSPASSPK
jgi:hypothetical protein